MDTPSSLQSRALSFALSGLSVGFPSLSQPAMDVGVGAPSPEWISKDGVFSASSVLSKLRKMEESRVKDALVLEAKRGVGDWEEMLE